MDKHLKYSILLPIASIVLMIFSIIPFIIFGAGLEGSIYEMDSTTAILIGLILPVSILFLVGILIFFKKFSLKDLGFTKKKPFILGALIVGLFLWAILTVSIYLITNYVEINEQSNAELVNVLVDPSVSFLLKIVAFALIPPLAEEIFFRALLLKGIENQFKNPALALFASSFLFSILHTPGILLFVVYLFMGGVLGYLFQKYKSIYPPLIAHIIFNLSSVILANISI